MKYLKYLLCFVLLFVVSCSKGEETNYDDTYFFNYYTSQWAQKVKPTNDEKGDLYRVELTYLNAYEQNIYSNDFKIVKDNKESKAICFFYGYNSDYTIDYTLDCVQIRKTVNLSCTLPEVNILFDVDITDGNYKMYFKDKEVLSRDKMGEIEKKDIYHTSESESNC